MLRKATGSALLAGTLAAFAVAPLSAQVIDLLESKQVMTYSSQLGNPALYGVLSAFTLGLYPSVDSYGRDIEPRASGNNRWPADAGELLRPVATKSFMLARGCTWVVMAVALLFALRNRRRRAQANSEQFGGRSPSVRGVS